MPRRNRRPQRTPGPPPSARSGSSGPPRARACRDKTPYDNRAAAELAAAELHDAHGLAFSVYVCPQCGKLHVGRQRD